VINSKTVFVFLLLVSQLFADAKEGKELFDQAACLECHNLEEFSSKKTKMKSFQDIESITDACQRNESEEWFDDEVHSVAEYLNEEFYKFKTD